MTVARDTDRPADQRPLAGIALRLLTALLLAIMFALFVLLLHLPGAIRHPALRIAWIVSVRETTFATGALSLFGTAVKERIPGFSNREAAFARV